MEFYHEFNQNFSDDPLLNELQCEMSKYKTLAHESIEWDRVFECSLQILRTSSLDAKILNYLLLAATNANKERYFEAFIEALSFFCRTLEQNPAAIGKTDKILSAKTKILKSVVELFIDEYDRSNLKCKKETAIKFNELLPDLENLLKCSFKRLVVASEQPQKPKTEPQPKSEPLYSLNTSNSDIDRLSDREYREFFINLALNLLKESVSNLSAYALFLEAMWGRIKSLPTHSNFITQIRYPEQNLIIALRQISTADTQNLKFFMQNLALNPFWLEGVKIFCEFLKQSELLDAQKFICERTMKFLETHEALTQLKFQSEESFCADEIYEFFANSTRNDTAKNVSIDYQTYDTNEALLSIENCNKTNGVRENLEALINMAELFESKNMKNNAKIIYQQVANLIENTQLKEYLAGVYKKARSFCK